IRDGVDDPGEDGDGCGALGYEVANDVGQDEIDSDLGDVNQGVQDAIDAADEAQPGIRDGVDALGEVGDGLGALGYDVTNDVGRSSEERHVGDESQGGQGPIDGSDEAR